MLFLYLKSKYLSQETQDNKEGYIISFLWIISEVFIFDFNYFNQKIKLEIQEDMASNSTQYDKDQEPDFSKIIILNIIIKEIKFIYNKENFEELNLKKEFLKLKFQTDGNLAALNRLFFNKNQPQEKLFDDYIKQSENNLKPHQMNQISMLNNDLAKKDFCYQHLTSFLFDKYEENFKSRYFVLDYFDERIYLMSYFDILNTKKELVNQDEEFNQINQQIGQHSPSFCNSNNEKLINKQEFIYKTDVTKINKDLSLRVFDNNKNKNNNNIAGEQISNVTGSSKQRSFRNLNFSSTTEGTEASPLTNKPPETSSVNLSGSVISNDWLYNLVKNNGKLNYKLKEDFMSYLESEDKVTYSILKYRIYSHYYSTLH